MRVVAFALNRRCLRRLKKQPKAGFPILRAAKALFADSAAKVSSSYKVEILEALEAGLSNLFPAANKEDEKASQIVQELIKKGYIIHIASLNLSNTKKKYFNFLEKINGIYTYDTKSEKINEQLSEMFKTNLTTVRTRNILVETQRICEI